MPERTLCSWCARRPGTLKCTRCRDASPSTLYCSAACQKQDWTFHKEYCGKTAYTFELTLLGSSNPVIKRTFDVPSWFTFRQLHYAIQYAMGPWQCCHLHEFNFSPPSSQPRTILSPRMEVLKVGPMNLYDDEPVFPPMTMLGTGRTLPRREVEESLLLKDVFGIEGRLRNVVAPEGMMFPLYYVYDFGDHWEHELIFKGAKPARAARPLFSAATGPQTRYKSAHYLDLMFDFIGCGPVEDSGAISGWEEVKRAFRTQNPTSGQRERQEWARKVSGLGDKFDPFKEPDVIQMNYEGRWGNHVEDFMRMSGEHVPDWGTEEDEEDLF